MIEIENQVTNKAVSARLKELGVPQKSYFQWVAEEVWDATMQSDYETYHTPARDTWVGAFTLAELGEYLSKVPSDIYEEVPNGLMGTTDEETASNMFNADRWAGVLIYLLENNLITL